jgi:hypothetical protein
MARSLCCYVNLQTYFICFAGYPRVLMQEYEGKLPLLIADYPSPNSSHDKVIELMASVTSKRRIEYRRHTQNIGPAAKFVCATPNAKGKSISSCEGGDDWTSPTGIKQQVVYFEGHPSASGCFHYAQLIDGYRKKTIANNNEQHIGSSTQFNHRKAFSFC